MQEAMKSQNWNAQIGRVILAVLLATAAVSGQGRQQLPPTRNPQTTFQATTDHIRTYVIVKDNKGQFVSDLRPDEFQVFEDGVPQKVTTFSPRVRRPHPEPAGGDACGADRRVDPAARWSPEGRVGTHLHRLHRRHALAGARLDQDEKGA
jgi:hypothetical protein